MSTRANQPIHLQGATLAENPLTLLCWDAILGSADLFLVTQPTTERILRILYLY
jgi:hypothetical protein